MQNPCEDAIRGSASLAALIALLATTAGCGFVSGLTNPGSATERTVTLRAVPASLPPGGGRVEIEATVRVGDGAEVGVPVSFRTTAGALTPAPTGVTDADGNARVFLDTTRSGEVTASVFAADIEVATSAPLVVRTGNEPVSSGDAKIKLSVAPAPAAAGSPVALTIRATRGGDRVRGRLEVDFGDGRMRSEPAFDRKVVVDHTYLRADTFKLTVAVTDDAGRLTRRTFDVAVASGS